MVYEQRIQGENGEELVAILPDLPVNIATHINITKSGGDYYILENICMMPMIFTQNEPKDNANSEKKEIQLTLSLKETMPFSRIMVNSNTLKEMVKKLKEMGVDFEG